MLFEAQTLQQGGLSPEQITKYIEINNYCFDVCHVVVGV